MSNIEDLEKYKKLLDEGALSEAEFKKLKQKLLGLKTDEEKELEHQQKREEALSEIEQMKIEKKKILQEQREKEEEELNAKKEKEEAEKKEKELKIKYQETLIAEKAKEKARIEVKQEKIQNVTNRVGSVIIKIILWIVTVFLAILGWAYFSQGTIISGIVSVILALLACPAISQKLSSIQQLEKIYSFKKIIVIILIILLFVTLSVNI